MTGRPVFVQTLEAAKRMKARLVWLASMLPFVFAVSYGVAVLPSHVLQFLCAPLITTWAILHAPLGYQACRNLAWKARRRREVEAFAPATPGGANPFQAHHGGVEKPDELMDLGAVEDAQSKQHDTSISLQMKFFGRGVVAVLLAPMAAIVLSIHAALVTQPSAWAMGLVLSEVLCLGTLLYYVHGSPMPTREWLTSRIRAELLRREKYLLFAGVGPYRGASLEGAQEAARSRCARIQGSDASALKKMVPLRTDFGRPWATEIWQSEAHSLRLDLRRLASSYLRYRVDRQRDWFRGSARHHAILERRFASVLNVALIIAICTAVWHAIHLRGEAETASDSELSTTLWLSLVGPPLAGAILALMNLFRFRLLSHLYDWQEANLARLRNELQHWINCLPHAPDVDEPTRLYREFQTLVLETEQSLTHEMEFWGLLIGSVEFEASP
jgi:hypothetical protein